MEWAQHEEKKTEHSLMTLSCSSVPELDVGRNCCGHGVVAAIGPWVSWGEVQLQLDRVMEQIYCEKSLASPNEELAH